MSSSSSVSLHAQTWGIGIPLLPLPHICSSSPSSPPLHLPVFGWLLCLSFIPSAAQVNRYVMYIFPLFYFVPSKKNSVSLSLRPPLLSPPLSSPIVTMSCWRRCHTHGERGQSRWRVGRWCLILLLCVLLCCIVGCEQNIVL